MSRVRTRWTFKDPGFVTTVFAGRQFEGSYANWGQRTEDFPHSGDCQPFNSITNSISGGTIDGAYGGPLATRFENYLCTYQAATAGDLGHVPLPALDYYALASQLLARTNPSRSSSQSLVAIAELREIPQTARELHDFRMDKLFRFIPLKSFRLLGKAAKLNLLIQFGLLPLYQDIAKMGEFIKLVDARVKEIERLRTRGLRRTIELHTDSATEWRYNQSLHSAYCAVTGDISKNTKRIIKGHIRWTVSDNFYVSDSSMREQCALDIYGLRLDPTSIWQAVPYSWLVNWFTNIGDFTANNRNSFNAVHSMPLLMEHKVTHVATTVKSSPTFDVDPFHWKEVYNTSDEKARWPQTAGLTAQMPFLTGRQLSILGSLSYLKALSQGIY